MPEMEEMLITEATSGPSFLEAAASNGKNAAVTGGQHEWRQPPFGTTERGRKVGLRSKHTEITRGHVGSVKVIPIFKLLTKQGFRQSLRIVGRYVGAANVHSSVINQKVDDLFLYQKQTSWIQ